MIEAKEKQAVNKDSVKHNMGMALRDIGIPPRPTILVAIEREMEKDEPDFNQLARILGSDVALAAALIKTANSPFFGFGKKVRSVPEALLVLGLKLIMQAIAGFSLQKAFQHVPNMERFWDSSAKVARVAGWLAKTLSPHGVRPEDVYTFGLFRDCGIPVLMIPFPEYRAILAEANAEKTRRFTDIERERLGLDHAEAGASLAESWLLPGEIGQAIRRHHEFDLLAAQGDESETLRTTIALAQLAEHLVFRRTGLAKTCEWEKVAAPAMEWLSLDAAQIDALTADCGEAMEGDG